jgi:hypothetical protein
MTDLIVTVALSLFVLATLPMVALPFLRPEGSRRPADRTPTAPRPLHTHPADDRDRPADTSGLPTAA